MRTDLQERRRVARGLAKGWSAWRRQQGRDIEMDARRFADQLYLDEYRKRSVRVLLEHVRYNWRGASYFLEVDGLQQAARDLPFYKWASRTGLALDCDSRLTALLIALYEKWRQS